MIYSIFSLKNYQYGMLSFFLLVGILETTVKYLFLFPDEEKLLFPLDSYPYFNADDTIIWEF